jgi:TonB family protein
MKNIVSLVFALGLSGVCFGQAPGFPGNMGTPQQLTWQAEQGIIPAQTSLGSIYAEGKGVPQDYVQAYMWLTLSIDGAVEDRGPFQRSQATVKLRKSIVDKMTPQQIEEAERLAKEWESRREQRNGNGPYVAGWGVVTPKDVFRPSPAYTDRARQARINGIVVVGFVVRKDGTVGDCKILRGLGYGLDESAIQTITTQWRFQPGTFKGKPVDVQAMAEVAFKIY